MLIYMYNANNLFKDTFYDIKEGNSIDYIIKLLLKLQAVKFYMLFNYFSMLLCDLKHILWS